MKIFKTSTISHQINNQRIYQLFINKKDSNKISWKPEENNWSEKSPPSGYKYYRRSFLGIVSSGGSIGSIIPTYYLIIDVEPTNENPLIYKNAHVVLSFNRTMNPVMQDLEVIGLWLIQGDDVIKSYMTSEISNTFGLSSIKLPHDYAEAKLKAMEGKIKRRVRLTRAKRTRRNIDATSLEIFIEPKRTKGHEVFYQVTHLETSLKETIRLIKDRTDDGEELTAQDAIFVLERYIEHAKSNHYVEEGSLEYIPEGANSQNFDFVLNEWKEASPETNMVLTKDPSKTESPATQEMVEENLEELLGENHSWYKTSQSTQLYEIRHRLTNNVIFSSTTTSLRACVEEAVRSGISLSFANLYTADLSHANLSHVNLSHANLIHANLSNANLSHANLSDADLYNADLSDADLSDANLSNANLSHANLSGANLYYANLYGAINVNLAGALHTETIIRGEPKKEEPKKEEPKKEEPKKEEPKQPEDIPINIEDIPEKDREILELLGEKKTRYKTSQNFEGYFTGNVPDYATQFLGTTAVETSQIESMFGKAHEAVNLVNQFNSSLLYNISFIFNFAKSGAYGVYLSELDRAIKTKALQKKLEQKGYEVKTAEQGLTAFPKKETNITSDAIQKDIDSLYEDLESKGGTAIGINMNTVLNAARQDAIESGSQDPEIWQWIAILHLGGTIVHEAIHAKGEMSEGPSEQSEQSFIQWALPKINDEYRNSLKSQGKEDQFTPLIITGRQRHAKNHSWYKFSQSTQLYEISNRFTNNVIFSSTTTSLRACVEEAAISNANLSYANLSNADLYNANLSNANLIHADLSHANLSNANLSHANLFHVNLYNAYLSHAILSYANLTNANLSYANLSNADLYNANLTHADLYTADLSNANLSYANLYNATNVNLSGALNTETIIKEEPKKEEPKPPEDIPINIEDIPEKDREILELLGEKNSWYKTAQQLGYYVPRSFIETPIGSDIRGRFPSGLQSDMGMQPWSMMAQEDQGIPIERRLGRQYMSPLPKDLNQEKDIIEEQLRKYTRDGQKLDPQATTEELLSAGWDEDRGYTTMEGLLEEKRPKPLMVTLKKASVNKTSQVGQLYEIRHRLTNNVIYSSTTTSLRVCVEEAVRSGISLSFADLYTAYLSNANLSFADLSGADLYNADLYNANLYGANLSHADLYNADLYNANLYGANLSHADLSFANLSTAILSHANLTNANLTQANLSNADLYNAINVNLTGALHIETIIREEPKKEEPKKEEPKPPEDIPINIEDIPEKDREILELLGENNGLVKTATLFGWMNNLSISDGNTIPGLGDRVMAWDDRDEDFSEEESWIKKQPRYNPTYDIKGFYYRWIEPRFKPQLFDDMTRDYSNTHPAKRFASSVKIEPEVARILSILSKTKSKILKGHIISTRFIVTEDIMPVIDKIFPDDTFKINVFHCDTINNEDVYAVWISSPNVSEDSIERAEKHLQRKIVDKDIDKLIDDLTGISKQRNEITKEIADIIQDTCRSYNINELLVSGPCAKKVVSKSSEYLIDAMEVSGGCGDQCVKIGSLVAEKVGARNVNIENNTLSFVYKNILVSFN